jgi:hypothetical protein
MGNKTNHPKRGALLTLQCAECGAPVQRFQSDLRENELAFCHPSHRSIYTNRSRGFPPAQEYTCACGCKTKFVRAPSRVPNPDNVFFNRDHYLNWRWGERNRKRKSKRGIDNARALS